MRRRNSSVYRLRAHHGDAQRELPRVLAHAAQMLAQDERIGRQDVGHRGLEVLGQLDLTAGVARPGGDGHAADALRPEVDAEAAGEQAVTGHVLEDVLLAHADHVEAAGHQIRPGIDVVLGVADGHRAAGGAAGAVHAHDLRLRHAEHARGVLVAQVLLGGEGDAAHVVQAPDAFGRHARLIQTAAVEFAFAGLRHRGAQPRQLRVFDLVAAPQFRRIKNVHRCSPYAKQICTRYHAGARLKPAAPAAGPSPRAGRNCPPASCPRAGTKIFPVRPASPGAAPG